MEQVFAKIEAYLAKRDPSKAQVPHVFKFVITKEGATLTTFVLDLKNFKLTKGDGEAEATLTVDVETLLELVSLKTKVEDAISSGKLNITGAKELALKMAPFLKQLAE